MYILHTGEDTSVPSENSLIMYQALHAHTVRAELHIFAEGKGLRSGLISVLTRTVFRYTGQS